MKETDDRYYMGKGADGLVSAAGKGASLAGKISPDPYRVWISEIMLQQTRTEAVKPYFNTWMEKFPTVHALAESSEAEVLHAWQGLGYYSRARNIHAAARKMDSHYGGRVPDELKAVESLPGIGSYTAGAILSIAYGKRTSAVDGNVLRMYARLYGIEEDILKAKGRRQVMNCVEQTLPEDAGSFNEALMDLGQEVCIPRFPRCSECLIASWCRAHREGKEKELPVRTKKKRQETLYLATALILRHGAFPDAIKGLKRECWPLCGNSLWFWHTHRRKRKGSLAGAGTAGLKVRYGNIGMYFPIGYGI